MPTTQQQLIGLTLALSSNLFIGVSYIITKRALVASEGHGTDSTSYLKSPLWWAGTLLMVFGELSNFAAYSFASAMLVTPLGALSVIISAALASVFLKEKLTSVGKLGCMLCILGSTAIVLHAPGDHEATSADDLLHMAAQTPFMLYMTTALSAMCWLIFYMAPRYGQQNIYIYISICSLAGSVSVMACKGFGLALRLTIEGNNQFKYGSTYLFALTSIGLIVIQLRYFNRALDIYSTAVVTPIYYVFFTTLTIAASVALFQGFNDATTHDIISAMVGFATIFSGVFLLSRDRQDFYTPQDQESAGHGTRMRLRSHDTSINDLSVATTNVIADGLKESPNSRERQTSIASFVARTVHLGNGISSTEQFEQIALSNLKDNPSTKAKPAVFGADD